MVTRFIIFLAFTLTCKAQPWWTPIVITESSAYATYDAAVLSQSPIIYFPQRETSGTTASDASGNGYNGTYTSVTLNNTKWVNGDNAPTYNASGNKIDFLKTGFTNSWNGDAGHFSTWVKVTNTAWTDGVGRNVFAIAAGSESFQLLKNTTTSQLRLYRAASGTTSSLLFTTRALGWFNLQVRWKTGEFLHLYYDGVLVETDTTDIGAWTNATETLAQLGTYGGALQGNLGPTCFYASTNDLSFVSTLATVPGRLTNMMSHVICDGDSLTLGGQNGAVPYPTTLQDSLGATNWDMRNFGVSGQQLSAMEADAATQVDVWRNSQRPRDVVICWGGSNDIFAGTNTATMQSRIQTYCANRKSAGFEVIVCTILPRSGIGGDKETVRTEVNAWIAANYATWSDGYVDLAADTRLDDYSDATYFNADNTHLTTDGYTVVAELIKAVLIP